MSIRDISSNGVSPNNRSDKAKRTDSGQKPDAAHRSGTQKSRSAESGKDQISFSATEHSGEMENARNVLRRFDESTIDRIKTVKNKIESGELDTAEVHKEVSKKMLKNLDNLGKIFGD